MPQQVHQQRNGRRTDPLDDFESLLMQVFIVTGEESSSRRGPSGRWGSGDWDSATPWLRPAANIIASACFIGIE